MKPRHLLRRRDRLPAIDASEAMRVHLFGAKVALAAAEAGDPSSLETALNRGTAIRQLQLAIRRLPPEAREELFQETR